MQSVQSILLCDYCDNDTRSPADAVDASLPTSAVSLQIVEKAVTGNKL